MEHSQVSRPRRLHDCALQSKGLLENFQKQYWPNYWTEGGKKEHGNYYKLVLMASVLEPENSYHSSVDVCTIGLRKFPLDNGTP
jgi:hypothetical protein